MRVNILTSDSIKHKHKYVVENYDSAVDIIKDYAKENNLTYEGLENIEASIYTNDETLLLGIVYFFKHTNGIKHFEGSAYIWSK